MVSKRYKICRCAAASVQGHFPDEFEVWSASNIHHSLLRRKCFAWTPRTSQSEFGWINYGRFTKTVRSSTKPATGWVCTLANSATGWKRTGKRPKRAGYSPASLPCEPSDPLAPFFPYFRDFVNPRYKRKPRNASQHIIYASNTPKLSFSPWKKRRTRREQVFIIQLKTRSLLRPIRFQEFILLVLFLFEQCLWIICWIFLWILW